MHYPVHHLFETAQGKGIWVDMDSNGDNSPSEIAYDAFIRPVLSCNLNHHTGGRMSPLFLLILIILLFGGFGGGYYHSGYAGMGYGGGGSLVLILLVFVLFFR